MYCPRCGETNPDSDRFCSSCGQDLATYRQLWSGAAAPLAAPRVLQPPAAPPAAPLMPPALLAPTAPLAVGAGTPAPAPTPIQGAATPQVPNYLGWASALLALCWPAFWAAIPALVHASRTEAQLAQGDLRGAWYSSRKAKTWCWVTFCAGCVLWVVILLLVVTLLT